MAYEKTTITKEEATPQELSDLLGVGDSILLQEEPKPGFFSKKGPDNLSFLSKKEPKVESKEPKEPESKEPKEPIVPKEPNEDPEAKAALNELLDEQNPEVKEQTTQGRPKVTKDGAIELTKKLIEKGTLVPFDDDKKIEDYTITDLEELWEANFKNKEEEIKAQTPKEFYQSLPPEMQYAAKYIADGGQDIKGLFKALGEVEDTRALSEDVPEDQETICKEFLTVTNFGTQEDVDTEVTSWKDLGKLAEKAEKFKPRLEKMRTEQVQYRLAQAETLKQQREQAAAKYQNSVYEILKPAKLGDLPLDKKTQGMLYDGLVNAQYPSISGRQTNLLGHLLEKNQFVEPNHTLIAEILWHLSDPQGFKDAVKKQGKTEATETIVRKLKTEESRKLASSSVEEKDDDSNRQKKIPRTSNFFKR